MLNVYVKQNELKKVMFIKGFNMLDLSINAEVSTTYLSQIVNGKKTPSSKIAKKIADALDVEIVDIFEIQFI
ncbi:helix-turn-helix domain-containing protein [Staphylococcus agnetis]|uniref:helix-turn-helix domain-containing protein n=1 Tax=Staphylococcus agnetis TaxID=985762 RepID=UPI0021D1137B|nr:helix-turn-helix transcriptional regulator [Staphylococcus agnetis]UXU66021.1 helix-turn-helix domain-containing protein [Staphylococcus agnetis]